MNDDELRERLHAMPEPTTTIDVDAVVADARRRRRPKVVGVGVAAVAGCLAFLAPVVVPGLLGPDPVTATLQEAGSAQQDPAGSAPDAPAAGQEPAGSALGGDAADPNGAAVAACAAVPAADVAPGLAVAFAAAPVDGTATLLVTNDGADPLTVRIGDVGIAAVADATSIVDTTVLAAADVDLGSARDGRLVEVAAGATASVDVDVATTLVPCAPGDPAGGTVVPLVPVAIEPSTGGIVPALGDPAAS